MALAIIAGALSVAGAIGSYGAAGAAADATADSMNTRANRMEQSADEARFQAEMNNLQLDKRFNENAANQVVMQAAGVTSARSLSFIQQEDQEDLDWDKRFMTMSGEYQALGYEQDASELRIAAITGSQIEGAGATTSLLSSAGQISGSFAGYGD